MVYVSWPMENAEEFCKTVLINLLPKGLNTGYLILISLQRVPFLKYTILMKTFSTFLGMIFGLALLAAFLAGGYFLFKYVANLFDTLEPQIKTLAIIASIVAFFCAAIIASGLKTGSQNSVSVEKAVLYPQLLALWSQQLKGSFGEEERAADSELTGFEQLLALHGSQKVITAYMNLRKLAGQEGMPGDELHDLLKNLLVEMRADIGRTESNLSKNDLLDLLLGRH